MCGRFTLTLSIEAVANCFNAQYAGFDWHPRYNIAPNQEVLTVVSENTGERRITPMVWGLVPHWSQDRKAGYKMINARGETLHEKPAYKVPFKRQRCLIAADGFYEWKKEGGRKVPYRITLENQGLFGMGGIWDLWEDPSNHQKVLSFSIITTHANRLCQSFHDRMPVIIRREDEPSWLDPKFDDRSILQKMLEPYPDDGMRYYEVSSVVNTWKNDSVDCILPV